MSYLEAEVVSTKEKQLGIISDKGRIVAAKLADYLLKDSGLRIETFKDNDQIIYYDYRTNEGVWHLDGEVNIKAFTYSKIKSEAPELDEQLTSHIMAEILEKIRCATYSSRNEFETKKGMVCCNNGAVNLQRGELVSHSPSFCFLSKIPVDYSPGQQCPKIDKFLDEVLGEQKQLFYEITGYCLQGGYEFQRAFIAVGGGDNGKSTALNILRVFLGTENVSACSLQELLEDKFSVADLYGRLANIHADIPSKSLYDTGRIKMLCGGDVIRAQNKFQQSFKFVNQAKLIFSCNILPESYDDSDAFFKRMILLDFANTIAPENQNRKLLVELTTPEELSGLLNKALEARRDLEKNGKFTGEGSIEDKRKKYTRQSDPIQTFINERIAFGEQEIVKQDLYTKYMEWASENRYGKVITQKTFFKKFLEKAPSGKVSEYQKWSDDRKTRTRVYAGVTLLPKAV